MYTRLTNSIVGVDIGRKRGFGQKKGARDWGPYASFPFGNGLNSYARA
jgi:hypothetical protein